MRDFIRRLFNEVKAFTDSIIIMDETWVLYSTPEQKRQSAQRPLMGENPPRKAKGCSQQEKDDAHFLL